MQQTLSVLNIMCAGCASTIRHELDLLDGVFGTQVDVAAGTVSLVADAARLDAIRARLAVIGYPEKGTAPAGGGTSLASLVATAKTFAR